MHDTLRITLRMMDETPGDVSGEMPVTPEQAIESAQRDLDTYIPGAQADEHSNPFYGYYTLHIWWDGEEVGMLSVNGFTRHVFVHHWHGVLLETSQEYFRPTASIRGGSHQILPPHSKM